jgi:hypothetical protein
MKSTHLTFSNETRSTKLVLFGSGPAVIRQRASRRRRSEDSDQATSITIAGQSIIPMDSNELPGSLNELPDRC